MNLYLRDRLPLIFLIIHHLFLIILIMTDQVIIGDGDPSQRVLMAISAGDYWKAELFTVKTLTEPWPFGYFLTLDYFTEFLSFCHIQYLHQLKIILILGVAMSFLSILIFAKAAELVEGKRAKNITIILLLSCATLIGISASFLSEIYGLLLFAAAFYFFIRGIKSGHLISNVLMASILLVTANTVRHEIFALTAGLSLALIFNKKYKASLLLGLLGCSFMAVKIIYAGLISNRELTFLNHHRSIFQPTMDLSFRLYEVYKEFLHFIRPDGLLLLLIFGFIFFKKNELTKIRIDRIDAYIWFPAITSGAFIFYTIFSGNTIAHDRFNLFPGILMMFYAAILLSRIDWSATGKESLIERIKTLLIDKGYFVVYPIIIVAYLYLWPSSTKDFEHRFPPDVWQTIDWINDHKTKDDNIAFDYLDWFEQPIMLYTGQDHSKVTTNFCRTMVPALHISDSIIQKNNNDPLLQIKAHLYLLSYQPKFVTANSKFDSKGNLSESFYWPFLKKETDSTYRFISPYFKETFGFRIVNKNDFSTTFEMNPMN